MTHSITYALMDPTGNMTLLAESPVPTADQPAAAALLTEREPATEQVGFLTYEDGPAVSLRMAGGEFCGNAAMSAAALAAERIGMTEGTITVRVSGTPEPVAVDITAGPDKIWKASAVMPSPLSAQTVTFPDGERLPVVRFDGIAHVILERGPDRAAAEAAAPQWCRFLDADAIGLLFLDRQAGTMTPLVYVPGAGTLCWENSCASGTTAAGVWLAENTGGPISISLRQPGGTLSVAAAPGKAPVLSGTVRLRKKETVSISI